MRGRGCIIPLLRRKRSTIGLRDQRRAKCEVSAYPAYLLEHLHILTARSRARPAGWRPARARAGTGAPAAPIAVVRIPLHGRALERALAHTITYIIMLKQ